jgi:hypothetical protein
MAGGSDSQRSLGHRGGALFHQGLQVIEVLGDDRIFLRRAPSQESAS